MPKHYTEKQLREEIKSAKLYMGFGYKVHMVLITPVSADNPPTAVLHFFPQDCSYLMQFDCECASDGAAQELAEHMVHVFKPTIKEITYAKQA